MRESLMAGIAFFCTFVAAADCPAEGKVARTDQWQIATAGAEPAANSTPNCVDPTAPTPPPLTQNQVIALIQCFDSVFQSQPDFTCDLVAVNPDRGKDPFGKYVWIPWGQPLQLTQTSWLDVSQRIKDAVNATLQPSTDLSIRRMALQINIPAQTTTTCLPGSYVLLMSFDCQSMQVYFSGKLIGACPLGDNKTYWRLWSKMYQAGKVPPTTPAPSS